MSEHDEQVEVISWCKLNEGRYPDLEMIYAVPNAGKRSIGAAQYYIAEGLKSGVPDLCLPVPRQEPIGTWHHGLYIEMKYGNNTPTDNQGEWIKKLQDQGYLVIIAYSAEEAIGIIESYLEIGK